MTNLKNRSGTKVSNLANTTAQKGCDANCQERAKRYAAMSKHFGRMIEIPSNQQFEIGTEGVNDIGIHAGDGFHSW